jgi:ureidoacrylate peracid hydrolase
MSTNRSSATTDQQRDTTVDPGLAAMLARRTSVLIVDMQKDYCLPEGITGSLGHDTSVFAPMARRLAQFLVATERELPHRIFIRNAAPKWQRSLAVREQYGRNALNRVIAPYLSEWYVVEPRPKDIVIEKFRYSAFADTSLSAILRANGTETVIIAGVTTDVCVDTTARDAFMHDYGVVVLSDCTAASTPERHRNALGVLDEFFGRCSTSDAVLAALSYAKATARVSRS